MIVLRVASVSLLSGRAPRSLEEQLISFYWCMGAGKHELSECSCGTQRWEWARPSRWQAARQGSTIVYNVLGCIRGWEELDSGY